jgi:hypothetical protein
VPGILGAIQGLTITSNPRRKTDHETNGQRQMPGWRALFGPREGVMIPQTDPDNARVKVNRTYERRLTQRAIIQQVALQRIRLNKVFIVQNPLFSHKQGVF